MFYSAITIVYMINTNADLENLKIPCYSVSFSVISSIIIAFALTT